MKIYDVQIPANTQIYIDEFIKLLEFDVLKPDSIVKLFNGDPDFKFLDWVLRRNKFESQGSS